MKVQLPLAVPMRDRDKQPSEWSIEIPDDAELYARRGYRVAVEAKRPNGRTEILAARASQSRSKPAGATQCEAPSHRRDSYLIVDETLH